MKARHAAEAITGTEITQLAGLLAFVKAVEPEFPDRPIERYGVATIEQLKAGTRLPSSDEQLE